jgi:hypothetical protein
MDGEEVFLVIIALVGATLLAYPLVRALADRIRPRGIEPGIREELQMLREDLIAEIQQGRREVSDLAERIEFTERLLAKRSGQ